MRDYGDNFHDYNERSTRDPRITIEISFDDADSDLLYLTSHDDSGYPGGADVVTGCVRDVSGRSQRIRPEQAASEIGRVTFEVVDKNSDVTGWIEDKLTAGDGLRHKKVTFYVGFAGLAWVDYEVVHTYIIDGVSFHDGAYTFRTVDIQRAARNDIFDRKVLHLTADIDEADTLIPVSGTDYDVFRTLRHDSLYSTDPSVTRGYVKIDDEIIAHSGMSLDASSPSQGTVLTVTQRGAFNTTAKAHEAGTATADDRNKPVYEYVYLEGPAVRLAMANLTGIYDCNINRIDQSYQYDFSQWSSASAAVSTSSTSDPTGNSHAYDVNDTSGSSSGYVSMHTVKVDENYVHGERWTASVFAKKEASSIDSRFTLYFSNSPSGTGYAYIVVDLSDGSYTSSTSTATIDTVTVEDYDTTWWRVVFSAYSTNATGSSSVYLRLYPRDVSSQTGAFTIALPSLSRYDNGGRTVLPSHWHLGIDPAKWIKQGDFNDVGLDLIKDDETGARLSFRGVTKTDGKKFIEKEVLLWIAAFMPIYSNGQIGLRRLEPILSSSSEIDVIDSTKVVDYSPLVYDYSALLNNISIEWNYNDKAGEFTKKTLLIDSDSITAHGTAPLRTLKFKGVHAGASTEENIANHFDGLRDRFSGPPMRIKSLTVRPSMNHYEVGDIVRLQLDQVRDYVTDATINRAFEIQAANHSWLTGNVTYELFASSFAAGELSQTSASSVLADSFYTSTGTELSTVLTISGGAVTANGTLTGDQDDFADAVYYYDGNLTINSGVTVTITTNVQLRIKGTLTINGKIDGKGQGGSNGTGSTAYPSNSTGANVNRPGVFGTTKAGGGIKGEQIGTSLFMLKSNDGSLPIPRFEKRGLYAIPFYKLENNSTDIDGLPSNLMGLAGPGGEAAVNISGTVAANGGNGGFGGAGLIMIARGFAWGGSGEIDTSGDDGTAGTIGDVIYGAVGSPADAGDVYSGSGGGGAPGGVLALIDGNASPFDLQLNHTANRGACPQQGTLMESYEEWLHGIYTWPRDSFFQGLPSLDQRAAASRVQYIPPVQTIEDDDATIHQIAALASITTLSDDTTSLTGGDGTAITRMKVTWTASTDPEAAGYEIQAKLNSEAATEWQTVVLSSNPDQALAYFEISPGTDYDVRVRVLALDTAQHSAWTSDSSVSATGTLIMGKDTRLDGTNSLDLGSYYIESYFESLDHFSYTPAGNFALTPGTGMVATASGTATTMFRDATQSPVTLTYAKDRVWLCVVHLDGFGYSGGAQTGSVKMSSDLSFKFTWNNGTSQIDITGDAYNPTYYTTSTIKSVSNNTTVTLKIDFDAGTQATFHVDASTATLDSTKIPTTSQDSSSGDTVFRLTMSNKTASTITVSEFIFYQAP